MLDCHTHTSFSDDCVISMDEMIEKAILKGLSQYAVTDHYDPDYPADDTFAFDLDISAYKAALDAAAAKYGDRIDIIKGIELGIGHKSFSKCKKALEQGFDFVIGSFHCIDYKDIWRPFHEDMSPDKATSVYYEYIYNTLKEYDDYDILGHINCLDRYLPYVPDFTPHMEEADEILKLLVRKDKGLEINTSSFRYNMGKLTMPSLEILKMYRNAGGTIITFGSDSHHPDHIGYRYDWACRYLKEAGFSCLAVYHNRMPDFIGI